MKTLPKNHKKVNLVLPCLILIGLILIVALPALHRTAYRLAADFSYPFLNSISETEYRLAEKSLLLESRYSLAATVEKLKKANQKSSIQLAMMRDVEEENLRLRQLYRLSPPRNFSLVFAEAIIRDPANWDTSFVINKGQTDGIGEGDAVLATIPGSGSITPTLAVVGRIRSLDISNHTAVVSTIISSECRLSAILEKCRAPWGIAGAGKSAV